MMGSVFYLENTPRHNILESCFLEMLGSNTPLTLQASRRGTGILEKTIEKISPHLHKGPFRSIICNDETVWESFGIPMSSLSRYSYPDYNLYIDPGQPAFNALSPSRLRTLMDEIPLLPRYTFVETLTEQVGLPFNDTLAYLRLWEEKGLISLVKHS